MKKQKTTRRLAEFISQLKYRDLPQPVIQKAKEVILDQVGIEIACSTLPWNKIVYEYVRSIGAMGRSTIVNFGLKTNAEYASLANATFGHGFEIDDYQNPALVHPGCVAVPAALSLGEENGVKGEDFILGVAVGCEVIVRIGLAAGYSVVERGFHEVSVVGPLGAAAAVGKIMNLDRDSLLNSISIAGSHSSGTMEYGQTGGTSNDCMLVSLLWGEYGRHS